MVGGACRVGARGGPLLGESVGVEGQRDSLNFSPELDVLDDGHGADRDVNVINTMMPHLKEQNKGSPSSEQDEGQDEHNDDGGAPSS